jgi:integrase
LPQGSGQLHELVVTFYLDLVLVLRRLERLQSIRIHNLRHTFASLLLQQIESVVYLKEQPGYASIQITSTPTVI